MKKSFFAMVICIFLMIVGLENLTSCNRIKQHQQTTLDKNDRVNGKDGLDPKNVIIVDGCEYYVVNAAVGFTYLHKGNCKNPIHQCNTQKSAVIKFYDLDGNYRGNSPMDSLVINYKTKRVQSWYEGHIGFVSTLKDMGMTFQDVKK